MALFASDALAGQIVFVTGATRGIGAAVAQAFRQAGATVIGTATSEAGAKRIGEALGDPECGIVLDVTDAAASKAALDAVVAKHGRIDVLVNNAGITRDGLAMRMDDEAWDAVLTTNLSSAFRLVRAALRPMLRARRGRIISVSSVVASMGNAGQANYCAAKGGLEGMTRAVAREVASRGITVNCVAPGFIDTDMTRGLPEEHKKALLSEVPLGRLGSAEDVAQAVLFLATDAASYVTGQVLHVNGGMLMR